MTEPRYLVAMPGRVWLDVVSSSGVPQEEHWPVPDRVKVGGNGVQYRYVATARQVEQIVSHVLDLYESFHGYAEAADDRRRLRPFLKHVGAIDSWGDIINDPAIWCRCVEPVTA